ncbi:MAG: amidophosphoribosyltransferase [Bacteroidales bacterium]|nr:amidophosphoribosyltransferase [Bacteroidales bacterium]
MEPIKHECGIALIRLLKPLEYYQEKYGTWMYGFNKLYLLMEKQHNRGQEGAGFAALKMEAHPGAEFFFRERAQGSNAISEIFTTANHKFEEYTPEQLRDAEFAKMHIPYAGEIYMGHLRYSTTGRSGLDFVHPFIRRNNFRDKSLCVCGNFNLTNVDEIFDEVMESGQHPRRYSDTYMILEQLGFRLDREVERLYGQFNDGVRSGREVTQEIEKHIIIENILKTSSPSWDGGYCICGMTGSGESFVVRDPWGIRPAFYYQDDEIVVVASERPVIQTAFTVSRKSVHELQPGQAIIINQAGQVHLSQINPKQNVKQCSFERIYFSRGNDADIYRERKRLGHSLAERVCQSCDNDLKHSVFSFIPNTAEVAFMGLVEGLNEQLNKQKMRMIRALGDNLTDDKLKEILSLHIRNEKIANKDIKLRTFIAEGTSRNDLASHVYDVTYGCIENGVDNLVAIDDSIVRGTTLKQSVIKILNTLKPRKIVIVSSAPQVRYPDCYGIDMSRMGEFIAFRAAVELLKENGMESKLEEVYKKCKAQEQLPKEKICNYVKEIYAPFTADQISKKISEMLTPRNVTVPVEIIYQTIEGLHEACPHHTGDWYFTGDYPTAGGNRLVNLAYINFYEGNDSKRAMKS